MVRDLIERIQNRTLQMDMSDCSWGEGVALWGFNHSVQCVKNEKYLPFLQQWVAHGLSENKFPHTVNTSIPCIGIAELYRQTGRKDLLEMTTKQADYLLYEAPRLKNGAIIHTDPYVVVGQQMWADTVFMAGLFLAYMGKLTGNTAYVEDAMKQLDIHVSVLQDEDGLLYHGWDETLGRHLGCKWGRANAWVSVCIVEMMDYASVDTKLLQALKKQLDGIAKYQKDNGMWRTVLDGSMSYLEASCTYGFGYAILKGVRLGVLEENYLDIVRKMEKTLGENVDADGKAMNVSAGTPIMRTEAEYNIICEHRIQPWGQGLALLYYTERMENGYDF